MWKTWNKKEEDDLHKKEEEDLNKKEEDAPFLPLEAIFQCQTDQRS